MITQQALLDLVEGDVEDVQAFAIEAARAGYKQLAINLYRCLPRINGERTVDTLRLKYLANLPIDEQATTETEET